ncbi:MAG TPA: TonB family protein [Terriglobales bacterium]|jgi:TonB family protein|nr:TonB family protein [Terriglobales bacterium]
MANRGAIPQPLPTPQNNSVRPRPQDPTPPAALAQSLQVHLQALADEILLLARGDGIAIGLAENSDLRCRAASGIAPPVGTRIDARSGLTGACLSTGTLLRCDDSEQDARVDRQVCRALGIRAMVCVPVSAGLEVVGIFEIFSCRPNAFLSLDSAALHGKAQEIANCFTAEEALARAAVTSAAELGTAGDLPHSWTPTPPPPHRRARLHLSSKSWQAVLGALVLALGVFLLLRAIRASGPAASAWIRPQPASAAASSLELPPAVTRRLDQPRSPQPRAPLRSATAEQKLSASKAYIVVPSGHASPPEASPQVPPSPLLAAQSGADVLSKLVGSLPAAQPSLPEKLRVSSGVPQPVLVRRVEPLYPALAKQSGIEGAVVLEALVTKDGKVRGLRIASGNSLLAAAALRAVSQWRYRPSRLNGEPIEVPVKITLNFELGR